MERAVRSKGMEERERCTYQTGKCRVCVCVGLASFPGRQLKFGKNDGLVLFATLLVRMR